MRQTYNVPLLCAFALTLVQARADLVTFEDQPSGPSIFAAAGPAQTLVYTFGTVTATFTGGVILTDESNETTDTSNVYATADFGSPTVTNPLTVTFNQPIKNFQIQILNALAGSYTMADNAGDSMNFSLATSGGSIETEGFAAAGTQVNILYNGAPDNFDFAIDNVTFDQPLGASTPEPNTIPILGAGLLALFGLCLRRRN
jgi:PEP-CTERM motif